MKKKDVKKLLLILYMSVYLSVCLYLSSPHSPPRHSSLHFLFRCRSTGGCREQLFVWSTSVVQQNCYSIIQQKECTNRGRAETNTNQETHTAVISCIAVRSDWKSFINMATKQYLRYWTIASPPLAGNKYLQSMSERFTGTETQRLLLPSAAMLFTLLSKTRDHSVLSKDSHFKGTVALSFTPVLKVKC